MRIKNLCKEERIWIVPCNDLEAVEIQRLLLENGEQVISTNQGWGASWKQLEPWILRFLDNFSGTVYGVELQGNSPCLRSDRIGVNYKVYINIDHHDYETENRRNDKSSIEQVAEILCVTLSRHQQLVSANDCGYIPELKQFGASKEEIEYIRNLEHEVQGCTELHEQQAIEAINNNLFVIGRTTIVRCKHSKTACVCDKIFGTYDQLLIISDDGEKNYFGDTKVCQSLHDTLNGWMGSGKETTYWGGYASEEEIFSILRIEGVM